MSTIICQGCRAPNRLLARYCSQCGNEFALNVLADAHGWPERPFAQNPASLKNRWHVSLDDSIPYLIGMDGLVIAISSSGQFWVIDENNGRILLEQPGTIVPVTPPFVASGFLLIAGSSEILAVDVVEQLYGAEGGNWRVPLSGESRAAGVAPGGELALALVQTGDDLRLVAVSAKTRRLEWQQPVRIRGSTPVSQIIACDGVALLGWQEGTLAAFSLIDGRPLARHDLSAPLHWLDRGADGVFLAAIPRYLLQVILSESRLQVSSLASTRPEEIFAAAASVSGTVCTRGALISRFDRFGAETSIELRGHLVTLRPLMRGSIAIIVTDNGFAYRLDIEAAAPRLTALAQLLLSGDSPGPMVSTERGIAVAGRTGRLSYWEAVA